MDGRAGVRTARQYLQESERALAGGRTETQSLSPHLRCQPTPNDAPTGRKPAGFSRRARPPNRRCTSRRMRYLSFCDTVDDGLQRFVAVTFEDSFHAASSGGNGLPHCHVQVIVGFLCRQVLHQVRRTIKFCQEDGGT